jgi:TFIIF-interacting CTD phosphatase-like protein
VLDLDNTLISSLSQTEYDARKIDESVKFTRICDGLYYTLSRPHLNEFLKYLFEHFHVSVWTASSKDYALEIIEKFIIRNQKNRKLKLFLYDKHCKESIETINSATPKDLRYLYKLHKDFHPNNTLILDDLKQVCKHNPNNIIEAEYFDSSKSNALSDTFLQQLLKEIQKLYHGLSKL